MFFFLFFFFFLFVSSPTPGKEKCPAGSRNGEMTVVNILPLHFIPVSLLAVISCRLALLEMSRFTVINLVAHLAKQPIMEGAAVIRTEPQGRLVVLLHVSLRAHKQPVIEIRKQFVEILKNKNKQQTLDCAIIVDQRISRSCKKA